MSYYEKLIPLMKDVTQKWKQYKEECLEFSRSFISHFSADYGINEEDIGYYDWKYKSYENNLGLYNLEFCEKGYCYLKFSISLKFSSKTVPIDIPTTIKFKQKVDSQDWYATLENQKDILIKRTKDSYQFEPLIKQIFESHKKKIKDSVGNFLKGGIKKVGFDFGNIVDSES